MRDDGLYLSNIKECIERIESYTRDGKEDFMQNQMIQDAVIRNFEIIGEATIAFPSLLRYLETSPPTPLQNIGEGR